MTYGSRHISDYPTVELRSMEPQLLHVPAGTFFPHNHPEYVEGCYRCDLSRDEVTDDS